MKQSFFGFENVGADNRTTLVQSVFQRVASSYDLMNDLMSLGIHRFWKQDVIRKIPLKAHQQILDVAGGTGDMSFRMLETYPHLNLDITVCDLTENMVSVGRNRAIDRGFLDSLHWVCGNAEILPIPDASMDVYMISFGMRNVTDLDAAIKEANRILKPGGHFACLEFSQVGIPALQTLYDKYSFNIIPWLGDKIANDRAAYQYLVESIRRFPSQEALANLLKKNNFQNVTWENYMGGIACLHQATKGVN
jgi:demethylmenaquinone methyltransferase/2-methoxy-6-polyprenyl-1,4-benzoquinol methylase